MLQGGHQARDSESGTGRIYDVHFFYLPTVYRIEDKELFTFTQQDASKLKHLVVFNKEINVAK